MKKKVTLLLFALSMCFTACASNSSSEDVSFQQSTEVAATETSSIQETIAESTVATVSDASEEGTQDSAIYAYLDELLQSSENPSYWSDDQIGLSGITDIQSDEYKTVISSWQEKIADYEQSCMEKCAEEFGISVDEVEEAYYRELSK